MISEGEINLWMQCNGMCALPVAQWNDVANRLHKLESEYANDLIGKPRLKILAKENKELKKNLTKSTMLLGKLQKSLSYFSQDPTP